MGVAHYTAALGQADRYYRSEDLALVRGIRHLLCDHGYTIKGMQKLLRERGVDHVKAYRASLSWSAVGAIPLGASPLHALPSVLTLPAQDRQMQRGKQPRQSPPELRRGNREVQVLRVPNREGRDADQVATIIEQAAARGTLRRGDLDVVSVF